jgi:alkyl hydroperoxide reductase subunit AhpC
MAAFEAESAKFASLDTQVLGISVDSVPTKTAWAESMGLKSVLLLSDFWPHGEVAQRYGMLREEGFAERAVLLVDKEGVIRYVRVYALDEVPDLMELFEVLETL